MSPARPVARAGRKPKLAVFLLLLTGLLLFPIRSAEAHPFDATFYSARAAVVADAEGVRIQAVIEIPTPRILEHFLELYGDPTQLDEEANEIFRQRQFERLGEDLRVRVNGRRVAGRWVPTDTEANGRGTEEFFAYFLDFEAEDPAAWQADRLDLRIDLEVFAREYIYLSASAEAEGPWIVTKNSAEPILSRSGDDLFDEATGQWSVDPRLRNLRFVLEKGEAGSGLDDGITIQR